MVKCIDVQIKSKEFEKLYNLTHYEVLQRFMFERILERISMSAYRDNFILKGGLLLSAMFGIDNRTTKDMDTTITGIDISKENMINMLNEILKINLSDNVKFDIVDITNIRTDDEYGGNRYHIIGRLENLKVNLEIDISTGDNITPSQLKFKYPLLFENRSILISTYNIETIISEKIETILRRGQYNSRMKDYYDIYYFLTRLKKEIDINVLKQAINNTFTKRESLNYLSDYDKIINSILKNEKIVDLWNKYRDKNTYSKDIEFSEIVKLLKELLKQLESEKVSI